MTTVTLAGDSPALTDVASCIVARFAEAEGLAARDVVGLASAVCLAVDHARGMVRHGAVHVTLSARAGGVDVCVDGLKLASRALTELRLPEGLVDEVDVPAGDPASLRFVKRFVRPDAGA